jgi:hypothetical protein
VPDAVITVTGAPDDGWSNHLKHVEQFMEIIVASCQTIIDTHFIVVMMYDVSIN